MPRYETRSAERTAQIITEHHDSEGPLSPILHAVQRAFGCAPENAVPIVAQVLNLSRAEVHDEDGRNA